MSQDYFKILFVCIVLSSQVGAEKTKYTNLDLQQLQYLMDGGIKLVDIRSSRLWKKTGIIKNSILLTMFNKKGKVVNNFFKRFSKKVKPNQPVAIISYKGDMSQIAAEVLSSEMGYFRIYNIPLGIKGWLSDGRKLKRYR